VKRTKFWKSSLFGVAGMMEFELIVLGPLAPLALLIGDPPRS
jgi:hypothetical protein